MLSPQRTFSPFLIEFVQKCEGYSEESYEDHGIALGFGTHRPWFTLGMNCTMEQAIQWNLEDLHVAEDALNRHLTLDPGQNPFDALISWEYEFGEGRLTSSTLLQKLNQGDREGAWQELPKWCHVEDPVTKQLIESEGLKKRRWTEQAIWMGMDWKEYQSNNYPALVYVAG